MRFTLRFKLIALAGTTAAAFVVLIISGAATANRARQQLDIIQARYLPKLEVGPRLEAQLDHLRRAIQDAVAARDAEALAATRSARDELVRHIEEARGALDPAEVVPLQATIDDYYTTAIGLSQRMIAGETGEALLEAVAGMQAKQTRAAQRLQAATAFDRGELSRAFEAAARAQATAASVRLWTSVGCLLLVVLFSVWMGRGIVHALGRLTAGLQRFGHGDFGTTIPVAGNDELGDVARQANQMAADLRRLGEQRDQADWMKVLMVGLAVEIRGELEPAEVAGRAVAFLAKQVEAQAGALYYVDARDLGEQGELRLLGSYAAAGPIAAGEVAAGFRIGEGLVGQASLRDEVWVVPDPPSDYLQIRSGLGSGTPRCLVFLPLRHLGKARGVVELALFAPWSPRLTEALLAMREMLVIAVEVARARVATRALLAETQRQAARLSEQEEELRATNEELQSQQEELRQTNRELTDQTNALEAQRRKLEENNAALAEARRGLEQKAAELTTVSSYKSQFLTNMSHELRTPLNSMLLLSNLLAENEGGQLTEKQVEFARTIHGAGRDLLALINQVLDLAKIEAGKHELHPSSVTLRQIGTNLRLIFQPLANDKKLTLSVDVDPAVPMTVTTDQQRLEQILKNLLANAIKFTSQGSVGLRVSVAGPSIVFEVSDTGVGIAPQDQQRVFAPFEQVEGNADRRFGGTGLGLSISRELAALLGGELSLRSTLGEGSVFTCTIPLAGPPAQARPNGEAADKDGDRRRPVAIPAPRPLAARADGPGAAIGGGRDGGLLVIEDDPVFAEALLDVIRGQGFDGVVAGNGVTGLQLARERRPTGIVLDVKLPDIDGWKVMEGLRADPITAGIPVHVVSAANARDQALALGAVGFLTKPTTRSDLVRVIESLTAGSAQGRHRVLVVEDDPTTGASLVKLLSGERLEVVHVTRAADALAALEGAGGGDGAGERFHCMILDLTLPDMDGLELLHAVRDRHGDQGPPVLVYTARALNRPEASALDGYAEAVILKDGASTDRLVDEVRLFVRRLKEGVRRTRSPPAATSTTAQIRLDGRRILLVDDDMRTAYALSALLRAKKAEVFVADTGQAALDLLRKRPDVEAVLMDIMMPEMDGYEAMRRIRQDARFRALPIIALTAKAMLGDSQKCLEAGADEYLPKPVDADRLLALLHARLARPAVPEAAAAAEAEPEARRR